MALVCSGKKVLALTEGDHCLTFMSQLRSQCPSGGYIIPCLMRLQVVMWLAKLARHTTFAPQRLGLFSKDLNAITRSRPSLNLNLCFLGTRGVINVVGIIWSSPRL